MLCGQGPADGTFPRVPAPPDLLSTLSPRYPVRYNPPADFLATVHFKYGAWTKVGARRGVPADAKFAALAGFRRAGGVTQEHGGKDPQMQVRILARSTNFFS